MWSGREDASRRFGRVHEDQRVRYVADAAIAREGGVHALSESAEDRMLPINGPVERVRGFVQDRLEQRCSVEPVDADETDRAGVGE